MLNKSKFKSVNGISFEWKESKGKQLRITISPKNAIVSVHVPAAVSERKAMQFVEEHIDWIKKNQAKVSEKIKAKTEKLVLKNSSVIYIWGEEYKLKIVKGSKRTTYSIDKNTVYIKEPDNFDIKKRRQVLNRLYKKELEIFIEEILPYWEKTLKEHASKIRYRDMKSKWGTCYSQREIITLNTRLAAYPCECAEMVLVHEFVHFKERLHNDKFKRYMTKYLPDWKARHKILNSDEYFI